MVLPGRPGGRVARCRQTFFSAQRIAAGSFFIVCPAARAAAAKTAGQPARNRVRPGRFASKYWSLPCGANTARCGFLPAPRGAETVHGTGPSKTRGLCRAGPGRALRMRLTAARGRGDARLAPPALPPGHSAGLGMRAWLKVTETALGGRRAPRLLPFPGATAPSTPPLAGGSSAAPQATFSAPGRGGPKSRPFSRLSVAQLGGAPRTYSLHGRRPPENAGALPCQAGPPDEAQHGAPSRRRTPDIPDLPERSARPGMRAWSRSRENGAGRRAGPVLDSISWSHSAVYTAPSSGLSAAPQATFSLPGFTRPKSRPFSRLGVAPSSGAPKYSLHGRRPPENAGLCHARLALLMRLGTGAVAATHARHLRPSWSASPFRACGHGRGYAKTAWEEGGIHSRCHFLEPQRRYTAASSGCIRCAERHLLRAGFTRPKSRPFSRLGAAPPWASPTNVPAPRYAAVGRRGGFAMQADPPDEAQHGAPSWRRTLYPRPSRSAAPVRACGHGQGHVKTALGGRRVLRSLTFLLESQLRLHRR